jgi:glycosyltransferase involved in cell wall biosynthesis
VKDLSIIFPCYNEAESIERIISSIEKTITEKTINVEIILVDNGSTDSTPIILNNILNSDRKTSFKQIRIEKNIGYGHGIMKGVHAAEGEIIAWTHADMQTNPIDVLEAHKAFVNNPEYPNCIMKGRRVGRNLIDTIFTLGMSLLSTLLLRTRLSDINAQPKMFHRNFLEKLSEPPLDFSLDLYLLYQARFYNYQILEHPVHFCKRLHGEAKGGGGTIKGKWKLICRTWNYMMKLKRDLNR